MVTHHKQQEIGAKYPLPGWFGLVAPLIKLALWPFRRWLRRTLPSRLGQVGRLEHEGKLREAFELALEGMSRSSGSLRIPRGRSHLAQRKRDARVLCDEVGTRRPAPRPGRRRARGSRSASVHRVVLRGLARTDRCASQGGPAKLSRVARSLRCAPNQVTDASPTGTSNLIGRTSEWPHIGQVLESGTVDECDDSGLEVTVGSSGVRISCVPSSTHPCFRESALAAH